MTVYVNDMKARVGRMIMCHMLADTIDELHAMADHIGVNRKWFQGGASTAHYDVALSKRALAIEAGAVAITWREAGRLCREWRRAKMGAPGDAG